MTHTDFDDEDDADGPGEDEGPGAHDAHLMDDDDDDAFESDTVACPACGKQVLAEADRCHRCGESFGREAWLAQRSSKAAIWAVAVVGVIVAMLWFIWG